MKQLILLVVLGYAGYKLYLAKTANTVKQPKGLPNDAAATVKSSTGNIATIDVPLAGRPFTPSDGRNSVLRTDFINPNATSAEKRREQIMGTNGVLRKVG